MEAELWHKIEELFQAALSHPKEQRAEFLRTACRDDLSLSTELQSLLLDTNDAFPVSESSTVVAALLVGQKLGNFEILSSIGSGGMGEVYRARDLRLKREVAMKVLPRLFARDAKRLAQFEREARAASALNHPNIVSVYDIGRQGEITWIVTELVDGESLRALMRKGPLPLRRVIDISMQIADGLAAAHEANLVHRDLKPENIMLARNGRVKILDFGLARRHLQTPVAANASTGITWPGIISGTPAYMSPEQIAGRSLDPRSDLFSLGIVMYELLAGKRPFGGDTFVGIMHSALTEDPVELPGTVPPVLNKLVCRCLEKQPERRFQSAADLSFALKMLVHEALPALPAPQERRRQLTTWATFGAALLLVAGASYWLSLLIHKEPPPAFGGTLRRLTWDAGLTTDGVVSTDGKLVAYASDRANQNDLDIYVQQIESGAIVRLTNDLADDHEPTFSPDGSHVAFRSERSPGGIYEVPALGGGARLLVAGGYHPRYSPDGQYLLYSTANAETLNATFAQPFSGGPPVEVSRQCSKVYPTAVWSPDSQRVLFWGQCGDRYGAWIGFRDGRLPIPIENSGDFFDKRHLVFNEGVMDQWLPNPSRLLIPFRERDASFEAAVPLDGQRFHDPVQRLTFGPVRTSRASAAPGGRVVLSTIEQSANLWRLPIDPSGRATGEPVPMTTGQAERIWSALSKNGKTLAFVLKQSGMPSLTVQDVATGVQRTLAEASSLDCPIFDPSGTHLVYGAAKGEQEVGIDGGFSRRLFRTTGVTDWSTHDKMLVVAREGGYHTVRVFDRATSQWSTLLSDDQTTLFQAHLSSDERWVTFISVDKSRSAIFTVPFGNSLVAKSNWIRVTDGRYSDDKPQFSPDGSLIYFVCKRDGYRCIWAQPLTADRHARGEPFAVYHSHSSRRSIGAVSIGDLELNVGPGELVFEQGEPTGNIWLLDPRPETTQ